VCKWTYQVDEKGQGFWARDFFDQIGLGSVLKDEQIGTDVKMPGSFVGNLTPQAAIELGLTPEVKVGTSLIDAHAGTLGMLGCSAPGTDNEFSTRLGYTIPKRTNIFLNSKCSILGLICGTSSCHMALNSKCLFVKGIWGPYFSAVLPNMWLTEGGQSASGRLIDHIIESHPAVFNCRHLQK
jgi:ribulose kinase